jgi:outer membrane receptor protein involved in Fe transport
LLLHFRIGHQPIESTEKDKEDTHMISTQKHLGALLLGLTLSLGLTATILAPVPAVAQGITTGGLTGVTVDQTEAVIPSTRIIALNAATGARVEQQARADGGFSLLNLPAGAYTLTFSTPGFADLVLKDVEVSVGGRDLGLLVMKPSGTSTTVEVTSANPLVETTQAQVSTTFDTLQLSNLPLNNGFDAVTLLEPGIVQTHDNNFSNNNGATFSSNGQRGRSNNFEIDGQSNNDNSVAGPQVFFGNQDAISGVQVITNEFSAQYGRNMGTVVNYMTKSGTNSVHGSVFELYEGNWGQAFLQGQKSPVFGYCASGDSPDLGCLEPTLPRFTQNNFGGTVGAPIMRDKLWAFGSVYFGRSHQGAGTYTSATGSNVFPTPDSLAALAAAGAGNGAVASMVNSGPYSIKTGDPHPGAISDTQIYTVNGVDVPVDYAPVIRRVSGQNNDEELMGRLDWQPTSKDHVFLRYIYQDDPFLGTYGDSSSTDLAAGNWYDVPGTTHSVGGDLTHTFSPSWVNQVRYSFQQAKISFQGGAQPECTINTPDKCNSSITVSETLPSGNGFLPYGYSSSFPQGRTVKVTQVQDNATWTHGRHSISFGGEWSYQNSPNPFLPQFNGAFSASGGIQGFLDETGTTNIGDGNYVIHFTEPDSALYLQDDWKVSPNLTLNLGLRWEYFGQAVNILHDETTKREADPAAAFWDTTLPLSQRTFPSVPQNWKNFQPRVGFAYTPSSVSSRLVVRGGFAINFDPSFYNMFLNSATAAPVVNLGTVSDCSPATPCLPTTGSVGADVRALTLPRLPRGVNPNTRNQTSVAPNFHNPYAESYTLGVQWGPSNDMVFEIRYAGNHTVGLFQSLNANPRMLQTALAYPDVISPSLFCADPKQIGFRRTDCTKARVRERANTAFSIYNGVAFKATTRNYHNLTSTFAYTFSRTIDNSSDVFSTFTGGNTLTFAQNPFDTNVGERGVSGISIPHVASASFVYDFPMYKTQSGLMGKLLGGYQLNGIWTFDTGQPTTPYELDYGQLFGGSGPYSFPGLSNYCDGQFSASFGGSVSTCRPVLSNKKAPAKATGIYLNPDSGDFYGVPAGYYTLSTFFDYLFGDSSTPPPTATSPDQVRWLWNNTDIADAKGTPFPGVGRNTLRANRWNNVNASIFKNTRIRERYNLQLQFSAYNVLNHRQLGTPDPEIDDTTTFWDNDYNGGVGGSARQVQIGAKFTF